MQAKYYRPEDDPNSEYVQLVRNHTKTEIKSITGRMFEVMIIVLLSSMCNNFSHS